jgi:hypothetical protein
MHNSVSNSMQDIPFDNQGDGEREVGGGGSQRLFRFLDDASA